MGDQVDEQARHPGTVALVRYFDHEHLPAHLQGVSAPFGRLARELVDQLPDSPELTVALRKLLEAKDCAVRATVDRVRDTGVLTSAPIPPAGAAQ